MFIILTEKRLVFKVLFKVVLQCNNYYVCCIKVPTGVQEESSESMLWVWLHKVNVVSML